MVSFSAYAHRIIRFWSITTIFFGILLLSEPVFAQCAPAASAPPDVPITCNMVPFGVINETDASANEDGLKIVARVFSATVCTIETIMREVFYELWIQISECIQEPLGAAIVLYIMVVGIMFAIGMTQMTLKEVSTNVFKILLVWLFATNADFGIDIMYEFYMAVLNDGIDIVTSGAGVNLLCELPDPLPADYKFSIMHNLDCLANRIFATNQSNESGRLLTMITGLFTMSSTIPGGALLGGGMVSIAVMTFFVFARTVLTYLIAIVGLTFYLMLAPIFISMALFKSTNHMFEKWLQQVVSFALQPVFIFAYLMLAEAYIENIIDTFPTADDLLAQTNILEQDAHASNVNILQANAVFMLDPTQDPNTCTNCYVDPGTTWTNGVGEVSQVMAGLFAMGMLNLATITFLDIVPEVARQLSSASRAIKIGGGNVSEGSFRPSGAAVRAPVMDDVPFMIQGIQNSREGGVPALQNGLRTFQHAFERGLTTRFFPN